MIIKQQKITIIRLSKPSKNINEELQWLGNSLDLFNIRDKDRSCFRIFIELLKATKARNPVASEDIAKNLGLSRGTVMYHINKLIEAGIVIPLKNRYLLRGGTLYELIDEIEKDAIRAFADLKTIAAEIDNQMK
ncbi:MAG: winged helix-turn-helix transcriptional regulator [Candidatus Woesearchaeota archaeon]